MAHQSDSLMSKTQKGLSILAFETNKQSRILKRRMQIAALQKEIKSDLRALGNLIYNAFINEQKDVMEEEDVRILAENIHRNKDEIERLRDMIARLGRAKKHFPEEDEDADAGLHKYGEQAEGAMPDDEVETVAEAEAPVEAVGVETEAEASVEPVPETKVDPIVDEEPDKPEKKSKKKSAKPIDAQAGDADEVPLEPEEEEKQEDATEASGSED